MTDVEKLILDKLDGISQEVKEVKQIAIEARDIAIEARDIAIEARDTAQEALKSAQIANEKIVKLHVLVDNHISKKIDAIGDGHDFLKMNLDKALAMEKERERMWIEIVNLRIDVNTIKGKLNVA